MKKKLFLSALSITSLLAGTNNENEDRLKKEITTLAQAHPLTNKEPFQLGEVSLEGQTTYMAELGSGRCIIASRDGDGYDVLTHNTPEDFSQLYGKNATTMFWLMADLYSEQKKK